MKGKKTWTPEQKQEIVEYFQGNGLPATQAKYPGIKAIHISNWKRGFNPKPLAKVGGKLPATFSGTVGNAEYAAVVAENKRLKNCLMTLLG